MGSLKESILVHLKIMSFQACEFDIWTRNFHCHVHTRGTQWYLERVCAECYDASSMLFFFIHKLTIWISVHIFQDHQRHWPQTQVRFGVGNIQLCILYPTRTGGFIVCFLQEKIWLNHNHIPRVNHQWRFVSQFHMFLGPLSFFSCWYEVVLCGYFRRGNSRWC